jgi:hypothetical protein
VLDPGPTWVELGQAASFVLWFGAMALHVLGLRRRPHLQEADWRRAGRCPGERRAGVVALAVAAGLLLGFWSTIWHLPVPR